jgi:site-specific DNA recombinase
VSRGGLAGLPNAQSEGRGLEAWAASLTPRLSSASRRGGLRFAFYGRVSTEEHQDPVTSRARQFAQAEMLVAGHGRIVGEYFDVGQSRVLPWARRPQAAALLAAMADPDRDFEAIVVGEYERASPVPSTASWPRCSSTTACNCGPPRRQAVSTFQAGPDEQLMLALGWQSKREITRTRIRVRAAMAAQTREQGRYLGGRPPFGYQLADAGPHPNKAHAAWGRRARRLEPDPLTAPVVKWMFAQRLAGHSVARITRALNDTATLCPSASDPKRNPHRSGTTWTLTTVAAILANPRYTGRQVWNRQRTDHDLIDTANPGLGHRQVQRWNLPDGWVISARPAHPALVSESDYIAAQQITAPRGPAGPATRRYLLSGLLRCGQCGRRMESTWSNGHPAYRCRHGSSSATKPAPDRPKNVHLREDQILPRLAAMAILLAEGPTETSREKGAARVTPPEHVADLIDHLRSSGRTLSYDPSRRTLRSDTGESVTVGAARS